jgi:hypothetical protein
VGDDGDVTKVHGSSSGRAWWMRDLTGKPGPTFPDRALKPGILARDDASSNRHPAPSICLSMISGQTRENRYPLFRIMLRGRFPPQKGSPAKKTGQYLMRCGAIYSENAKKQWFV